MQQAALLLQKTLRGRSVQLRIQKGRQLKQDLITAMMIENPVTDEDQEMVDRQLEEGRRIMMEHESLQSKVKHPKTENGGFSIWKGP